MGSDLVRGKSCTSKREQERERQMSLKALSKVNMGGDTRGRPVSAKTEPGVSFKRSRGLALTGVDVGRKCRA